VKNKEEGGTTSSGWRYGSVHPCQYCVCDMDFYLPGNTPPKETDEENNF